MRVVDASSSRGWLDLTNAVPVAILTGNPQAGNEPLLVNFDATASTDPEGTALTYDYDWNGDGTYDALGQPAQTTHTYATGGQITAIVRATDIHGGQDTGPFELDINTAPVADLQATPAEALTGSDITFDASGTTDNSPVGDLTFDYDLDGDGAFELTNAGPTVTQTMTSPGAFTATVRVIDPGGLRGTATAAFEIVSSVTITDQGSPAGGNYTQADGQITLRFNISGGKRPYSIDWYLVDAVGTAPDTRIATGGVDAPGTYTQVIGIDSTTGTPVADSGNLPLGKWQIEARPTDGSTVNDPDAVFEWPADGSGLPYSVYRYNVVVVQDAEGDSGGTVSSDIHGYLETVGYLLPATPVLSTGLTVDNFLGLDAVVWATDAPATDPNNAFEYFSLADSGLMRTWLDGGGHLVVFARPSSAAVAPYFPSDADFQQNYWPFNSVTGATTAVFLDAIANSFTGNFQYSFTSAQFTGSYGSSTGALPAGAVSQLYPTTAGTDDYAAVRQAPAFGGNLYFCMVQPEQLSNFTPTVTTIEQILDNMVAGTINF